MASAPGMHALSSNPMPCSTKNWYMSGSSTRRSWRTCGWSRPNNIRGVQQDFGGLWRTLEDFGGARRCVDGVVSATFERDVALCAQGILYRCSSAAPTDRPNLEAEGTYQYSRPETGREERGSKAGEISNVCVREGRLKCAKGRSTHKDVLVQREVA